MNPDTTFDVICYVLISAPVWGMIYMTATSKNPASVNYKRRKKR